MRYIEIIPLENGAHENIITPSESGFLDIPDFETWAIIPDDMELPYSYPFVDIETELRTILINGNEPRKAHIVISMLAKEVPEEVKPEPEISIIDQLTELAVDQEYRLTLLEAGL